MNEEETQILSKHNSSVNILIRLDGLWKDANNHRRQGQFSKWNHDLDVIWCELARDLDNEDFKKKKETFESFERKIGEFGKFDDNAGSRLIQITKSEIINRDKQYKNLMDKDLFLRRLENFLGKGTAWQEEEDNWE